MPVVHLTSHGAAYDWYRHELGWRPCWRHDDCLIQHLPPDEGQLAADAMGRRINATQTARGRRRAKRNAKG